MRKTLIATAAIAALLSALPSPAIQLQSAAAESTALPGGMVLVEEVTRQGDEIVIPYKKYRLPNGLTVVLHEDNSDPIVHVDVTYHVGSGREEVGKSGFAHFFEHMMFQGSENVADEEHFKIITEAGGTLNGTTNTDRTNYFETVPSNQLEKMLWLEADRMGFLLDAVTQQKFEVQRATVKNERGQRVDNRPYGLLGERVGEAMYPEGHPYSWSVIGYLEDLDRANLADLKKFFLRWYGPNNAALTIGGKIDEQQTLEWVAQYFGSIPAGPEVADPEVLPVELDADRYISLEDNVQLPLIYMSWPTVNARHPDEAPLDVLMNIMGQGRTSLLYKNLVKGGKAVQAQASHGCREIHCTFDLLALPTPGSGQTLADLESTIRASLVEFEERGAEDDDLARVKAGIVSGMVYGLESVSGKVSQLAAYETFTGNPNYIQSDIERYESVTKEDVMRVYQQYIKDKPAVIMSIVPRGQDVPLAAEDTWQRYERNIPEYANAEEAGLELRPATDTFDRSVQPPASDENPSITLPEIWRTELGNGIKVLGAINEETPTTAIQLRIETGQRNETLDKLGLAALTASMMNEATQNTSSEELSNELSKLGSSISFNAGDSFTTMTVRSLTENLDATLELAREKLLEPGFKEADFARLKQQTLAGIKNSKTQPNVVASEVFTKLLFGADNAFANPNSGTEETVTAITLDDVKAFYAGNYSASLGSIIAVSDLPQSELEAKLAVFEGLEEKDVAEWTLKDFPELATGTLYLIDKPGAAQSEIRIGKRALPFDATDEYYRSTLMNFALGGAFNSRININLREDKGYTYGARGFFAGDDVVGRYQASAGVRTDATSESIYEFLSEIHGYQSAGIKDDELAFTKAAIGQSEARDYETPFQKLGFLGNILRYDLSDDYVDEQKAILANLSKEEVDALAAKNLRWDEMIMLVVGDKAQILPKLEGFGFPIVELDADGNPVE